MRGLQLKAALIALALVACGDDDTNGSDATTSATSDVGVGQDTPAPEGGLFTAAVTAIVIEIDYETGAAPYTGQLGLGGDIWDIFEANVAALFTAHPKTLTLPKTLAEMEDVGDLGAGPFSTNAILALADQHRAEVDTSARRTFYFLWLDGVWEDNGNPRNDVLAINIGDTGVIAIFKPVIAGTGLSKERVEQTTLVHEFGHAVGLVNVGVPPVADHHDEAHGGHCDNPDCIMFWRNEVGADLSGYVAENLLGSTTVIFDQDCLDDAAAAAGP